MARNIAADLDAAHERRLRALGMVVERLESAYADSSIGDGVLYEIRFKLDADGGTSTLAILKRLVGAEYQVSFVGGYDLSSCLLALGDKLRAGRLQWREDRPWGVSGSQVSQS